MINLAKVPKVVDLQIINCKEYRRILVEFRIRFYFFVTLVVHSVADNPFISFYRIPV